MPAAPLSLVVHGAAGRMGQRVIAGALAEPARWRLAAAIERIGHPRCGVDAGGMSGCAAVGPKWPPSGAGEGGGSEPFVAAGSMQWRSEYLHKT